MSRPLVLFIVFVALVAALTSCGGDDDSQTAAEAPATATSAPEPTPVPPTATTALEPTVIERPAPTTAPEPTEPAATEVPTTATPEATATPGPRSEQDQVAAYAAEHSNGPGAIFVGDPTQLIGPPPHDGLMFQFPPEQYNLLAGAALAGSPELQVPSHMFIYTSDYYQGLIRKANLTNPTELVSSGENIEIQHVCLDRNLPPCVLIQAYYAH